MEESNPNMEGGGSGEETPHLGTRQDSKPTAQGETLESQDMTNAMQQRSAASSTMSDVKQQFFLYTTLN